MKSYKIAIWGFLIAGVLGVITALRDLFAPGFFNISPQIKGTADVILQFVSAAAFFALAYLFSIIPRVNADKQR